MKMHRIIRQYTLFETQTLEEKSIERLRKYEPPEGYYLAFSGGKDSIVLKDLAIKSGVKFDAHYNLTTVDPPELVRFMAREHPDVADERPEMSMWQLIIKEKYPPTRLARYCCRILKERGGNDRTVLTGIRWEESPRRKNRAVWEEDNNLNRQLLHPIIDWSAEDIWNYILSNKLSYCSLYDEGFHRLGCILCPQDSGREKHIYRWPKYYKQYLRTFDRMLVKRKAEGKEATWRTPEEVMAWWLQVPMEKLPDL